MQLIQSFLREKNLLPQALPGAGFPTGSEIAAIDPLLIDDLTPLRALKNPQIIKIFHACSQDLEVLLEKWIAHALLYLIMQVAKAFLGMRQQVSYAGW